MKLGQRILNLLFPPKCILCGKILREEETDLCRKCRINEPRFEGHVKRGKYYDRCWCLYRYTQQVRDSIHRFKFGGRAYYGKAYGRMLAMVLLRANVSFDLLTWVPVSRQRLRKRGYDQSRIIAESVAAELRLPCVRTLMKVRHTPSQTTLSTASEREANVKNAFQTVHPENFSGKRILLIDDILTSGATLTECAGKLRLSGAGGIECAVVAVVDHDKTEKQ